MKNWIIAFAVEKFYVTEEDAKFYMEQVASGKKFIALRNGMMLSDRALYIIPSDVIEESKQLAEGKQRCEFGKYHTGDCHCSFVYEIENGVAVKKPKSLAKQIEEFKTSKNIT